MPASFDTKSKTIARDCLAVRLRRLSRSVNRVYEEALRPVGLTCAQLNLLTVTARMGTVRPSRVGLLLELDASTLSRSLARMREAGWIEEVDDGDARARAFRLTQSGRGALERAFPRWRAAQREAASLLGEDGVRFLRELPSPGSSS